MPSDRPPRAAGEPPGLKSQAGAALGAAKELLKAHVELGKTELSEIGGQLARVLALGGLALAVVLLAGILLALGGVLFLGEWLFGSLGWGVLHGTLLFMGVAVAALIVALRAGRIGRWLVLGTFVAAVLAIILGLALPNRVYTAVGESLRLAVDPAVRPLLVGIVLVALIGAIVGVVTALAAGGGGGGAVAAFVGGLLLGAIIGALTAIDFAPGTGAAVGITIGLIVWIGLMLADLVRTGVAVDSLKARFYPSQTVDTAKETFEWLKERMPPGIGS